MLDRQDLSLYGAEWVGATRFLWVLCNILTMGYRKAWLATPTGQGLSMVVGKVRWHQGQTLDGRVGSPGLKLKENEMSILTTVCGPCADNIQKHFDFISNGVDLNGQGSCISCYAPADLGFVLPKSIFLLGLEGILYAGVYTFEVVGFDLSKASELVRDFTELSASLNAHDSFVKQRPQGIGKCEVSVTDEDGYTISLHASHDLVMRYMAKFGVTKRGAGNE